MARAKHSDRNILRPRSASRERETSQRLPSADRHKALPEGFAFTEYIFIPFRQPLFLDRRSRSEPSEGAALAQELKVTADSPCENSGQTG